MLLAKCICRVVANDDTHALSALIIAFLNAFDRFKGIFELVETDFGHETLPRDRKYVQFYNPVPKFAPPPKKKNKRTYALCAVFTLQCTEKNA